MKAALKTSLAATAFLTAALARASDAPPPVPVADILRSCILNSLQGGERMSMPRDKGEKDKSSTHDMFAFPETADQSATKIGLHVFGKLKGGYYRIETKAGGDEDGVSRNHIYYFRIHGGQIEFTKPGSEDILFSMSLSSTEENFNKTEKTAYGAAERTKQCVARGGGMRPGTP